MPPRPSRASIVYPPNVSPTPGASRSLIAGARPEPVAATTLALDQVSGSEGLESAPELPDELRELGASVQRLVRPDGADQLLVRAERRRPADRLVALGHVAHEAMRLSPNLDLLPLPATNEDEPRLPLLVAEARPGGRRDRRGG